MPRPRPTRHGASLAAECGGDVAARWCPPKVCRFIGIRKPRSPVALWNAFQLVTRARSGAAAQLWLDDLHGPADFRQPRPVSDEEVYLPGPEDVAAYYLAPAPAPGQEG